MNLTDENIMPEPNSGCWIWLGGMAGQGYGRIGKVRAHRAVYEYHCGSVPEGMVLDHLCRNRVCVNPAHLEPVTHAENTLRGEGPTAINAAKDECCKGHPLSGSNLMVRRGRRYCRECQYSIQKKYRARCRAALSYQRGNGEGRDNG